MCNIHLHGIAEFHMDMDNAVPVIFLAGVWVSAVPLSSLIS